MFSVDRNSWSDMYVYYIDHMVYRYQFNMGVKIIYEKKFKLRLKYKREHFFRHLW